MKPTFEIVWSGSGVGGVERLPRRAGSYFKVKNPAPQLSNEYIQLSVSRENIAVFEWRDSGKEQSEIGGQKAREVACDMVTPRISTVFALSAPAQEMP